MGSYKYRGKELKEYFTSQLEAILGGLQSALNKRNEASKHPKFDKINNKKGMDFPPPNPEFLKLKTAIEEELKVRKNAQ
jgi:hypothetical protein